jgi:hypothetical protein
MSASQPRPSARIGPIRLHTRLDKPVVVPDTAQRLVTTEPTNEPTIYQSLGESVPKVKVEGTCLRSRARKFLRLLDGGPFELVSDRYTGHTLARAVSIDPYQWRPSAGNWGFTYSLDLVGVPAPADGERTPLPGNTAAARESGRPTPRPRPSTKIAGVELPPRLNQPAVAIDGEAEIHEHDVVGKPSVAKYGGRKASTISITGSAFVGHARRLNALTAEDQITVRSDLFRGEAIVESVGTGPTDGFYETNPDRPGWKYAIQLKEVLGQD